MEDEHTAESTKVMVVKMTGCSLHYSLSFNSRGQCQMGTFHFPCHFDPTFPIAIVIHPLQDNKTKPRKRNEELVSLSLPMQRKCVTEECQMEVG